MEKQIEEIDSPENELQGLEKQVRAEILKICPLLSDEKFLDKYERVIEVAEELHLSSIIHYRDKGHFRYFRRVGVNNINDFLRKLDGGDWEAVLVYEQVLKTLSK